MDAYFMEICKLEAHFDGFEFHHVPKAHNVITDVLSKLSSKRAQVPASVFVQDLWKPSIKVLDLYQVNNSAEALADPAPTDIMMIEVEEDLCAPFIALITDKMVLEDKIEHEKLARCSANYVVIGKELYRKVSSTGILMKCILCNRGIDLLHEIHWGTCGNHAASGTLVGKAFHSGGYVSYLMSSGAYKPRRAGLPATPLFFMVYGSEAILPSDVAFGAPHIQYYKEGEAKTSLQDDIDILEEH
ncbi:uncharacterized protein LOC101779873 [Setaria italica]|uniref:uncharacterized protein LOC101779873 n=1 Tax=Setaria italica TaxID=4555 RepID=UPI000350D232|nr:uncharacterized protein LOC101779873 [Setaria italica]